jgi:methionyl-tRNA formyltransferase
LKFSAVSSFVIIGGGQSVLDITKYVIEIGCKAKVVTSPRHASESNEASGTFESAVKELGAKCIVVGDINSDLDFDEILDDETFGIAIGPAWIFHQPMLTAFSGRLVNFHSIPLPRFRGGAHFTWQILQRDRTGGLNIQLIDRKLDAGAVIMTESYSVPNGARKPIDYFNALDQHALPFLQRFLDRVLAESEFEKVPLKEESSLYMPRLSTVDQAFIDWSWSGDDILKFIAGSTQTLRYRGVRRNASSISERIDSS